MCPDLENQQDHSELLVLPLMGHSAIVRTVCFNPLDDFMLLSGGLSNYHIIHKTYRWQWSESVEQWKW